MKIRNTTNNLIVKLNGERKLWDSIYDPIRHAKLSTSTSRRRRDADPRARLLTLQISVLTSHESTNLGVIRRRRNRVRACNETHQDLRSSTRPRLDPTIHGERWPWTGLLDTALTYR